MLHWPTHKPKRCRLALALFILLSASYSGAKELHVYRGKDGTRWITDRWMPPQRYAYIGKYGRPTATQSCRGLKQKDLDDRFARHREAIDRHAKTFKIDPMFVKAVMRVESCFDVNAVSRVGAQGLMQLMPFTAKELGVKNSFDADQNIRGGVQYLSEMLRLFKNDQKLALAAYNAGPGAVQRHKGVPPFRETRSYIKRVFARYKSYKTATN